MRGTVANGTGSFNARAPTDEKDQSQSGGRNPCIRGVASAL